MRAAFALLMLIALSGCATPASTPAPPAGSSAPGTQSPAAATPSAAASPGELIKLEGVDVCSLLDQDDVQAITGESVRFVADGRPGDVNSADCFWGAAVAGVPAYVDVSVFRTNNGLATWQPPNGCPTTPVTGVGADAVGATCTANTQQKVWLAVTDKGLIVTVRVNEPSRPLAPGDLATAFEAVWAGLQ